MDLILWRHAEAQEWNEGDDDMARALTARGYKQAKHIAAWLNRQLPEGARVLCSPARRCEQTALALERKYKLRKELAPGATADALLAAADWPDGKSAVVLVGHQPALGQVIAQLAGMTQPSCTLRKGALWWLRTRERDGQTQTQVLTVQSPDML
ncbi:MAG: histidine phosphatase family protein [Desulfovibrionaceae bacterium]|nr:histidine phosphatase family protein [Desulfovibrionaceae bacterium]